MPIMTLYRAEHAILIGQNTAVAAWDEWSFEPAVETYGIGRTGLRCYSRPAGSIAVRVPPGAKVEDVATKDGRAVRRLAGLDAAAVAWLAERGERGFKLEADDMAKRRPAGPTLFGDESIDPMPTPGTAAPASPDGGLPTEAQATIDAGSMQLARIREALRAEALESAVTRALAQIEAAIEADDRTRCVTARAILAGALIDRAMGIEPALPADDGRPS